MAKRIEHHQTIIQTQFRVVDDERSYPPPPVIQQTVFLLTEAEFRAAMEQIRQHLRRLQEGLSEEEAETCLRQSES
jgi:hypothetical protein